MVNNEIDGGLSEKSSQIYIRSPRDISEYFCWKSINCVLWINTENDNMEDCFAVRAVRGSSRTLYRVCGVYHNIGLAYNRVEKAKKEYSWVDNETYFLVYNYIRDEFYVRPRYDKLTSEMKKILKGAAFDAIMLGKWDFK